MYPTSEDIKDMLESSAISVGDFNATSGWSITIGELPDNDQSPDTVIAIYDTPGLAPAAHLTLDYPSVNIKVRGSDGGYRAAWIKAKEVVDALNGITNETWNSTRYIQILAVGDPLFIEFDENNRPLFSTNFDVQRTA